MSEEAVLLKLKRDFEKEEAVQLLLKMVSDLEFEIGVLKSERDEAIDKAAKINAGECKTKKEWLHDELIADMQKELKRHMKKNTECNKAMQDWRNKYFSLMAKTTNT